MKEHFTSWSTISKSLNGRTENSIKNYFYSTVRRIQSCKVVEYFDAVKLQNDLPRIDSPEEFHARFELDSLNQLGVIICKWLFSYDRSANEHKALFDYLLNVIADEKKRPKLKSQQMLPPLDKLPGDGQNTDQDQGFIKNILPELFSGKNYQGVHPLLPLALYGGFGRLKSKDFFKTIAQEPQASSFPSIPHPQQTQASKFNLDNTSDISVPIPQVKYTLKENPESLMLGDLPNRLSEVLRNDRLQHSLFNLLISNLSKSMQAPQSASNAQALPAGNWNSSSEQHRAAGTATETSSPPFRASQQPRNTGFSPVNLSNFESRAAGSFTQKLNELKKKEKVETDTAASQESQGLTEGRKSSDGGLKCSKCLLTSQVCSCLL